MKKGKGKTKSRVIAEKYEQDGDSSDGEMPEVVSNATMKSSHELLNKQLEHLKQQLRQAEKAKRRKKQEMFVAQKKTKQSLFEEMKEDNEKNPEVEVSESKPVIQTQPKAVKKVYPSLNVTVEPLTKINDSRASAALSFKSRRLARVPRENVKTAVISYQKKLNVRK